MSLSNGHLSVLLTTFGHAVSFSYPSNIFLFLCMKHTSWRQHIVGSCLQIRSDNFTVLIAMFTLFTLNVIIYMVRFVFYLSLLNMFFVPPFLLSYHLLYFFYEFAALLGYSLCLSLLILLIALSCNSLCSSDSINLSSTKTLLSPP